MLRYLLPTAALFLVAPTLAAPLTPPPSAITVRRAPDGAGWDITLPPALAATVTDQVWLVVDGKSQPLSAGGDFYPEDARHPLRFRADASSVLDSQVKDILKAQGLATKPEVTTYHLSYGLNGVERLRSVQTLHFHTMQASQIYLLPPAVATYQVGDRITLYGVVALDDGAAVPDLGLTNGARASDVPDPADTFPAKDAPPPSDQVHRIFIQVQFVPRAADKAVSSRAATRSLR